MAGIKNIAQRVCALYPSVIVAGGFALSNYYKHRLPTDLDLWNVPADFKMACEEKEVINQYLTKLTVNGLVVDCLSSSYSADKVLFPPVYVDMVRCLDKQDLAVGTVHQILNQRPLKRSVFYDLYMLLTDFKPCSIVSSFLSVYPAFDRSLVVSALTNFDLVENSADALLLDCCGGWENVKSVITQKVRACLG
jgi:hypothetical protein